MSVSRAELEAVEIAERISLTTAAIRFLVDALKDGSMTTKDIYRTAYERGIAERTLQRAMRTIGVVHESIFRLPDKRTKNKEGGIR